MTDTLAVARYDISPVIAIEANFDDTKEAITSEQTTLYIKCAESKFTTCSVALPYQQKSFAKQNLFVEIIVACQRDILNTVCFGMTINPQPTDDVGWVGKEIKKIMKV